MKKILLFIFCCSIATLSFCQPADYWQQQVNYKINVSLNDSLNSLDAFEQIQYFNNSPDSLHFIWFHVWPNAYKNDRTAFSDQLLENGRKDFYFSSDEKKGYINRLNFEVDGITAQMQDHPQQQDIIKLVLPKPIAPGSSINIQTAFHVKLPYLFSRSGYTGKAYQLTQWYPKPAVYDRFGWHEMPYLDQGEFYSEFGNYDVEITVPGKYIVAATGEKKQETVENNIKTLHFIQNNVHDFAWFADAAFEVLHDTLTLSSRTIDLYAYYYKSDLTIWKNSLQYIKQAITTKSKWIGEYPYNTVSVVESMDKKDGGMEYPTITVISSPSNEKMLDYVINHEIGHNWFYGILASNEREHPWMDEGINSYYDRRYNLLEYKKGAPVFVQTNNNFLKNRLPDDFETLLLQSMTKVHLDQPIETSAEKFSEFGYNAVAYTKTAQWMKLLERELGRELFDILMHEYYSRWKFKHPYPEDFKKLAEELSGKNLDITFALLNTSGSLKKKPVKRTRFSFLFSLKETTKYQYIFFTPALGYNNYDKLMVGAIFHNYSLPAPKLKFILAPLYATGSKQLNGIADINYTAFINKCIQKVVIGINGERFSSKQNIDTSGTKIFEGFYKAVPYLQVFFKHNPRSTTVSWIDVRTYLIGEKSFSDFRVKAGGDSSISYPVTTVNNNRFINQISFNVENFRVLYPYNYQIQMQQGIGFYRFNVNAGYFFNYPKHGGLHVRLFASKFGYLGKRTYEAYQYTPKLLAATGEQDYSYSNYFIGRSASTSNGDKPVKNLGLAGQQIMIRDGGLKLRLDQFDYLQGRSEDWVAAMNFNTTIPDIFPVRLPVKLFLDVGTYAEGWKKNAATSKFLYVGGLQLSLFNNILNIYAPLVYSKDFKNTLKTTPEQNTFLKRLTFSIDIQNIKLKKGLGKLAF